MKYDKSIYLYVCDYLEGVPVLAVAKTLNDIPEEDLPAVVGLYELRGTQKIRAKREIVKR